MERAQAIVHLAEAGDATAVYKLVDLLQDEDPVVRMYAILALEQLCGQNYGYKYYQADAERLVAVERWREALRNGEVVVRGPAARPKGNSTSAHSRPAAAPRAVSDPVEKKDLSTP